ncbi:MAG TPA: helix-turn-helix domain-containing protein [Thermoanaerobaculia bacterium]|jgi:DNA-binding HxlR family transcriptional regulator|nr:helix-turn-helix domain-containing protein [Thermoanaerobaculia bacterium]
MPPSDNCAPPPGARSICPIANALDLLGDKWTLLVVRDLLFFDKHRFGDFTNSLEGIPTNILTDRLRRLEDAGVVVKVPYSSRPQRFEYHLTPKGADLFPILRAMIEWAGRHVPGVGKATPEQLEQVLENVRKAMQGPPTSADSKPADSPQQT